MPTKGIVTRKVTKKECNWLNADLERGTEVFMYDGCTYGCMSNSGVAVTNLPDQEPAYEIPIDSVVWQKK